MQISNLRINGFKSFGKKTDFVFGKPITAIVGPNGSGKSNITESLRFVLGEQSFKSMRSKDATDLLFRGKDSKANMLQVAILFKDTNSCVENASEIVVKNALEKGEVEIARIVYADNKNKYTLNGLEVRLKDIQETLLALGLSQKASWHISQGESDKILLAGKEERKSLVEDALGLRIYHTRIDEAFKKLEKTKLNIREANLKRKEVAPEIAELEKQITRIEKVFEYKQELKKNSKLYFYLKNKEISQIKQEISGFLSEAEIKQKISDLEREIYLSQREIYETGSHDSEFWQNKKLEEERLKTILNNKKEEIQKRFQILEQKKIYNSIELEKNKQEISEISFELQEFDSTSNDILFKEKDVSVFKNKTNQDFSVISSLQSLSDVFSNVSSLKQDLNNFLETGILINRDSGQEKISLQIRKQKLESKQEALIETQKEIETELNKVLPEIKNIDLQIVLVQEAIDEYHKNSIECKFVQAEKEKDTEKYKSEIASLESILEKRNTKQEFLLNLEKALEEDRYELKKVFKENLAFLEEEVSEIPEISVSVLTKNIEKLLIKIEEYTIPNAEDLKETFTLLKEKDNFLISEIEDLEKSTNNLEQIIQDLTFTLKNDFEIGIEHINNVFDSYIKKLFSGGSGKVIQISEKVEDPEGKVNLKTGLEVEVDLPKKKVKGLHSLSGGERALVSIALTVAIFNQNKTPFMVLDEADATLDEANAKRYGELLEMIKQDTKVIVVTHNRETMAFADEVYGITLDKTGSSQVLSVSFEDALLYAK